MLFFALVSFAAAQSTQNQTSLQLPSSKTLQLPSLGSPQRTNSLPTAIALSPDGKYLAILNNGYGTAESKFQQSIALLNLATNELHDFPDARLGPNAKQTYFLGLAWSSDGHELYASMASLTDPEGKKPGDTGNGIAVYGFENGTLSAKRFLKLPPVKIGKNQHFAYTPQNVPKGMAIPYPAGIAVVKGSHGDELLVAENLADDAVLMSASDGKVLRRFDLSRGLNGPNSGNVVPSQFPYAVVAQRDGRRAWCSVWNGSAVFELELQTGRILEGLGMLPSDPGTAASAHSTAMLLSHDEHHVYVTLANRDIVAVVGTEGGPDIEYLDTRLPGQQYGGTYPNALAQSADGKRLYVANASSDAIAVFDLAQHGEKSQSSFRDDRPLLPALKGASGQPASYFMPTEWYPTALAVHGDELLIATGKGEGTGPNAIPADRGRQAGKGPHQLHRNAAPRLHCASGPGAGGTRPREAYGRSRSQ